MSEFKQYMYKRTQSIGRSRLIGGLLVVLVHGAAFPLLSFNGLKYIYPPPEESSFLIDFTQIEEVIPESSKEPRSEEPSQEPIDIVQKSQSPIAQTVNNETQEAVNDNFGDVETPAPPKPEINQKALFPGMKKKASTADAPHSAKEASENFKAGKTDGNSKNAKLDGRPIAKLQGREVEGNLGYPVYDAQVDGIVVVTIWVDIYGKVREAQAGAEGTTIVDKRLWGAAVAAAKATAFTPIKQITTSTPELQEGTITYKFKLK